MDNDKICELLDEISLYFYQCYRNAGGGTRACEKFHDYMCAVDEAKALLKEQEAIEPVEMIDDFYPIGDPLRTTGWKCGKCGERIAYHDNYCPNCGKKVRWDD